MLSGLKFIPRNQIDDQAHDEKLSERKSYKKKKKPRDSSSSEDGSQRIKRRSKKKWYSSEEDSSSSESDRKKKKHKSKRKEYSNDDEDKGVHKKGKGRLDIDDSNVIIRKEMGLEWMLRSKDDTQQKPALTSDLLEETPTKEIKKANPRELNPYYKNDGSGYPEEEEADGDANVVSTSVVGDGGASWRLKALKRAQEQAAREGKKLDEVVGERWGSLGKLAVSVASGSAAPTHAHIHAIKNRIRLQNKDPAPAPAEKHAKMRVPRADDSLSWGQRKSESDASVISSALSSLQKFSNDGSFLHEFKSQENNVSIIKPALTANQLAAKVMQLRMKGKHEEADKLLKEADEHEAKSEAGTNPRSRYMMHDIKRREKKTEEDGDMHVARSIIGNKQYKADDEYDYEVGPKRKKQGKDDVDSHKPMRILTQKERCNFCFENPKRPRHLVIAIANFTYLMLPPWQPLVPGHCCILPMQHELATTSVDDNVWDEIRNFKKCLLMMFAKQEREVVFLETVMGLAKQTRHCLIECIPLPLQLAKQAPLYFKKAIDEAEEEWSQHAAKKLIDTSEKGLRQSIPKDFPYFHVEFGLKKGFVHVIDDESEFKSSFGVDVVRGMLRLPPAAQQRHKHDSIQTQKQAVFDFTRHWEPFDWTNQLHS